MDHLTRYTQINIFIETKLYYSLYIFELNMLTFILVTDKLLL